MTTVFSSAKVELAPGMHLYIDGNSKITCEDGTYEMPAANAFSLPHISTCPGSTEACREGCYVHGLEKHAPETYQRYRDNERVMHWILSQDLDGRCRTPRALARWIKDRSLKRFRWHVSGDVFSAEYARWIALVCRRAPDTRFWIYTRTLQRDIVEELDWVDNLEINISADRDNYAAARKAAGYHGLRLCYFDRDGNPPDDLPEGSVIFPDYSLCGRDLDEPTGAPYWKQLTQAQRKMVCPADFFGQSKEHRCGPCKKCLQP